MSNKDDFNAKLDAIQAIPNEQIQTPALPVDVFLQEAENLHHWSLADAEKLASIGITQEMIDDLPVRAGALREAQSLWFKDRYSQEEAQKEWAKKSPQAYTLRDELLHGFRYAYRNDETLLGRVSEIAEGSSHADMIQDLNDLSVLGDANNDPLNTVGFDTNKLAAAAEMADTLADVLATANGDKAEHNESKIFRDKAYTYLKELVDEVRDAGKYLFWKNETRYRGYISEYRRKHRSSATATNEITE